MARPWFVVAARSSFVWLDPARVSHDAVSTQPLETRNKSTGAVNREEPSILILGIGMTAQFLVT